MKELIKKRLLSASIARYGSPIEKKYFLTLILKRTLLEGGYTSAQIKQLNDKLDKLVRRL